MKARVAATPREIKSAVKVEFENQYEELYRACATDLTVQALATVLWTLSTAYCWKEQRLKKFVSAMHDTDDLMENPSRLHHKFDPLECEKEIKDKYGIDLRAEFPARVEVKP